MELDVRRVGLQSCFVALPQSVLEVLLSSSRLPSFPVVIELTSVKNLEGSAPFFVAWDGAGSSSPHIEVPDALAECIGLPTGVRVRIRARGDVAAAESVVVEPATEDDWEILELNAEYLENHILSNVGIVTEGQKFPVWVTGKVVLTLRVTSTSPKGTVKLVPGAELVVAPKKRQLNTVPSGRDSVADERRPQERNLHPVREAWFRVQELDSSFEQTLELAGLTCSTTPTTAIFISPNSAKAVSFEDGQLVVISSGLGKSQLQMASSKGDSQGRGAAVNGQNGKREGSAYIENEDGLDLDEETQHRDAIVQLIYRQEVAAGHVMVAFPLRVFIGAAIHTTIQLQDVSVMSVLQPSALILSPVLVRPVKEVDSSGAGMSDDFDAIGISKSSQLEKDENYDKDIPERKWQGHRHVLNAACGFNEVKTLHHGVHGACSSALLLSWWEAQVTLTHGLSSGQRIEGLPMASEAIVHIRIGSLSDQDNWKERQLSHKLASSSMPEVFLMPGRRNIGSARNFLFCLSALNETGGISQHEREQRLDAKVLSGGKGISSGYFLLQRELLSLPPKSAVKQEDKVTGGLFTVQQGLPCHLSCIMGMTVEVIEGPTLKSLTWLEGPASDALARLELLLSSTLRNEVKLLGTPLPGSVLLYGPPACGKSQLALALARELQDDEHVLSHRVLVRCSELVGEQALAIRGVLQDAVQEALQQAPSLIILDDLDVLLPVAESEGPELDVAVHSVAEFLADLIDICQGRRSNEFPPAAVAFLGVAKAPTALPACLCFSGRLDFYVQLASPAATERAAILSQVVTTRGLKCSESVAAEAAANCDGADATDVELLVDRAVHAAASRFLSSAHGMLPSQAAATVDSLVGKDQRLTGSGGKSLEVQQALPIMQKKKFELLEEDFTAALKDFVPLAMRGVTQARSQQACTGWEDVGGLYDTRVTLQEMLEMPVKYSKIFSQAPLRLRTGVLLYGPPGCGKTHIVGAAAAACSLRLISVKGPELLNKYIGASEQGVRDIFARATAAAPCILFFDEFDAIAPQRGHDNTGVTDRVVNQLLTELDGVEALNGVFVFAATSRPDLLDAALLRPGRLDRLLLCDFPSSRERYEILHVLARKLPLAEDVDLDQVVSRTEGFSGADLQAVLSDAQLESVHSFLDVAKHRPQEGKPIITMVQLLETANKARPSVPHTERRRLYAIYDSFMGAKRSLSSKRDNKGKKATLA